MFHKVKCVNALPEYLLWMKTYYIKMSQYLEESGIKEEIEGKAFDEQE